MIKFINDDKTFNIINAMIICFSENKALQFYSICCYELYKDVYYRNNSMVVKDVLNNIFFNAKSYSEYFDWVKVVKWVQYKLREMPEPP